METVPPSALHRVAAAVREACAQTAAEAFERAGLDGLCREGAIEQAVGAIRSVDLEQLIQQLFPGAGTVR